MLGIVGWPSVRVRSHSVPIIDGLYQSVGEEYRSVDVKYEKGSFSMDIVGAYATDKLSSLKREFKLFDDRVELTDTYSFREVFPVVERIVFTEEPVIEGAVVRSEHTSLDFDPDKVEVTIGGEKGTAGNHFYYFADFKLNPGISEFKVVIR